MKFVATKKGMTKNFSPSLLLRFSDPGSGMGKKSGSGISRIRNTATVYTVQIVSNLALCFPPKMARSVKGSKLRGTEIFCCRLIWTPPLHQRGKTKLARDTEGDYRKEGAQLASQAHFES